MLSLSTSITLGGWSRKFKGFDEKNIIFSKTSKNNESFTLLKPFENHVKCSSVLRVDQVIPAEMREGIKKTIFFRT